MIRKVMSWQLCSNFVEKSVQPREGRPVYRRRLPFLLCSSSGATCKRVTQVAPLELLAFVVSLAIERTLLWSYTTRHNMEFGRFAVCGVQKPEEGTSYRE